MTALRTFAGLALGASLALAAPAGAQTAAAPAPAALEYFPVPVSSRWIEWDYTATAIGNAAIRFRPMTIHADRQAAGAPGYRRAGFTNYRFAGEAAAVVRDVSGKVSETGVDPATGLRFLRPWYDFAAAPGTPVGSGLQADLLPGVAVETQNDATPVCIVTEAGVFENCRRVVYSYGGGAAPDGALVSEIFAPGIGLVERTYAASWGSIVWRLANLRTSAGFSLIARRPLAGALTATPDQIVIGGAPPRPGFPPPARPDVVAKVHYAPAVSGLIWAYEGRTPVTFYAIGPDGRLLAKIAAPRLSRNGWVRIDNRGVDYTVTIPGSAFPIGTSTIVAESNLWGGGAAPAWANVEVIPAP
jgi:hypothetical protein